ncbi:MAG TPA: hypothetical protein GX731_06665, partial [Clostridiales bacterium]|nr:hypothetical protein [Clostridiales bacterium]
MKDSNLDKLLRESLTQTDGPSYELNQSIKNQIEEHTIMHKNVRKLIPIPLLVVILTLLMSFSVFAAWKLLGPDEVANELGDSSLAIAFQSEDAIVINETVASGGYSISFLGVVSGEDLSDFKLPEHDTNKTYAIVAISKEDGSPMPATNDDDYRSIDFFVSPLIKGENPWLCNIVTMNHGGYTEQVMDGIMYRLIECDDVEIFADRGLYLCVSSTTFYSVEAYNYNEETGVITPNPEFDGVNVLFDLPLDPTKADPEKAEKHLQELYSEDDFDSDLDNPESDSDNFNSNNSDSLDFDVYDAIENGNIADLLAPENLDALMEVSVLIPESVKELSYTDEGLLVYEYEGFRMVGDELAFFPEGFIGMKGARGLSEGEKGIG